MPGGSAAQPQALGLPMLTHLRHGAENALARAALEELGQGHAAGRIFVDGEGCHEGGVHIGDVSVWVADHHGRVEKSEERGTSRAHAATPMISASIRRFRMRRVSKASMPESETSSSTLVLPSRRESRKPAFADRL